MCVCVWGECMIIIRKINIVNWGMGEGVGDALYCFKIMCFLFVSLHLKIDFRKFEQLINLGSESVKSSLVQPSGVTVFVPLDTAFQRVANIRWANLNSNQTLVDMVCIGCRSNNLEKGGKGYIDSSHNLGIYWGGSIIRKKGWWCL